MAGVNVMLELRPDHADSVRFLQLLYPRGPWCLTALGVDRIDKGNGKKGGKPNQSETFNPGDEDDLVKWLREHASWNIYYSVNEPRRVVRGHDKAFKQDVERVWYFHVDLDLATRQVGEEPNPKGGKAKPIFHVVDGDIARLRRLFDEPLEGLPRAPICVESGGGLNGLWPLDEPLTIIGGTDDMRVAMVERIEGYNKQIELLYSRASVRSVEDLAKTNAAYAKDRWGDVVAKADHCHNLDRILRLPGTINWPDEVKRSRGRVPSLARLVRFEETRFPLTTFSPAVKHQDPTPGPQMDVPRPSNVERLTSLDHLAISDELRHILKTGDATKWHGDRSDALFFAVCELYRSQIPQETIFAIITDSAWGISESVLDKQRPEEYAMRQIRRARDATVSPHLDEMNQRHCVIRNYNGDCVVIEEVNDGGPRSYITFSDHAAIKKMYDNIRIRVRKGKDDADDEDAKKPKRKGSWWLDHPMRNQREYLVFDPEEKCPPTCYNLWRGFTVDPVPGDCQLYLDHIRDMVGGNQEYCDYLLDWMAMAVQKPARPGQVAIVLRGEPGAGKGTIVKWFGALWGRHYFHITDPSHLTGTFNFHLRDAVVVFADEAVFAGNRKEADHLRGMLTEGQFMVTKKFHDAQQVQNFLHVFMASNHDWVVPAQGRERRYCVFDVSSMHMQDQEYFGALKAQMENGGLSALLYVLKHRDVSKFNPANFPRTEALREQKILSLPHEHEWWFTALREGCVVPGVPWDQPVPSKDVYGAYIAYSQQLRVSRPKPATEFGKLWARIAPAEGFRHFQKHQSKSLKPYYYQFPPLAACRAWWEERVISAKYPWEDTEEPVQQELTTA